LHAVSALPALGGSTAVLPRSLLLVCCSCCNARHAAAADLRLLLLLLAPRLLLTMNFVLKGSTGQSTCSGSGSTLQGAATQQLLVDKKRRNTCSTDDMQHMITELAVDIVLLSVDGC
jgi:hypothetical protein